MTVDLSWMRGASLAAAATDKFGWQFAFSDGSSLRTEVPWRVIGSGRIALGSVDHGQQFGRSEPVDAIRDLQVLLLGREVSDARVAPASGDLVLEFSSDVEFEVLNTSAGYEGWDLTSASGQRWIAQGGGRICCL